METLTGTAAAPQGPQAPAGRSSSHLPFPVVWEGDNWKRTAERVTAARVARMFTDAPEWERRLVPVTQFIMDWNDADHDTRIEMVRAAPDPDCDGFYTVVAATVAHALCDRDGVPVPEWVPQQVLNEDRTVLSFLSPTSEYGQHMVETSPAVCRHHRLYIGDGWLDA